MNNPMIVYTAGHNVPGEPIVTGLSPGEMIEKIARIREDTPDASFAPITVVIGGWLDRIHLSEDDLHDMDELTPQILRAVKMVLRKKDGTLMTYIAGPRRTLEYYVEPSSNGAVFDSLELTDPWTSDKWVKMDPLTALSLCRVMDGAKRILKRRAALEEFRDYEDWLGADTGPLDGELYKRLWIAAGRPDPIGREDEPGELYPAPEDDPEGYI